VDLSSLSGEKRLSWGCGGAKGGGEGCFSQLKNILKVDQGKGQKGQAGATEEGLLPASVVGETKSRLYVVACRRPFYLEKKK